MTSIKELRDILLWKKCVFMTFEQYKKKKEHINDKIYYHEGITNNIKKHIIDHIKNLSNALPFKKVPKPIYVLVSKHIEYDKNESILSLDCKKAYDDVINQKINYSTLKDQFDKNKDIKMYQNYNISCFKKDKDNLYDINDIPKYKFIYDNLEGKDEEIMKSSLSSYKFNGLYEVIIYVPNLNKDLQYFTSFQDFSYSNRWINLVFDKDSKFLTIIPFEKDYRESIISILGEEKYTKSKSKYDDIIKNLNLKNNKNGEFPFIKDLTNICMDLGCSSKYGEDLVEIVPTVSTSYDEQLSNARAKGPYFPTKCLKTDYYSDHMMNLNTAEKKNEYKDGLAKKLLENIDNFIKNKKNIENGNVPEDYSSTNIIDIIKGSASSFRNEKYKEGTNDDEYSKEYNRKILSELAFRYNTYPGVQEITLVGFRLNDDFHELDEYTHFMPWGNILLKEYFVLNDGDVLDIDKKPMKSFNGKYEMKFDKNSRLSLFHNNVLKRIIVNKSFSEYTKRSIVFQNSSLNIFGFDRNMNNDNRYSMTISSINAVSPLSIVIENNGDLCVYDNGFNIIKTF